MTVNPQLGASNMTESMELSHEELEEKELLKYPWLLLVVKAAIVVYCYYKYYGPCPCD